MSFESAVNADVPDARPRKIRQAERAQTWKMKQNRLVMQEIEQERNARFARFALERDDDVGPSRQEVQPQQLPTSEFLLSNCEGICECEYSIDSQRSTITTPLPVQTLPLQLFSECFYDMMIVEDPMNAELCSFEQFNKTVHLQLFNTVYPKDSEDNTTTANEAVLIDGDVTAAAASNAAMLNEDITAVKVELPHLIQQFINSAKPFTIPVEKIPNGAFIRTHNVKEEPVKEIVFKPELVMATETRLPPQFISRFYSIYDFTESPVVLSSAFGKRLRVSPFLPSDAVATTKLLANIPIDAHSSWKISSEPPSGVPEMHYLMYGPLLYLTDQSATPRIREPPPPSIFVNYRLHANISSRFSLYQMFSEATNATRVFDANYRRIMERSKVQKIFRDLRRIPMNVERTVFLKY